MPGEIWAYTLDSTKSGLAGPQPVQVGGFGFLLSDSPFHDGLVMDMSNHTLLTGGIEDFLQQHSQPMPDDMSVAALRSLLESFVPTAPSGSVEGHAGTLSVAGEHMVVPLDVMQSFAAETPLADAFAATAEEVFHGQLGPGHALLNPILDPVHIVVG